MRLKPDCKCASNQIFLLVCTGQVAGENAPKTRKSLRLRTGPVAGELTEQLHRFQLQERQLAASGGDDSTA